MSSLPSPRRSHRRIGRSHLATAALCGLAALWPGGARPDDSCPEVGTAVIVDVHSRTLWLCGDGRALAQFPVALGRGGLDKREKGDRRTPIGTYSLGDPRPSARFGVFIPVAYPTAEQRGQGYTGGDVGIHGPDRRTRWAGVANTWSNWTDGCIALGSDEDLLRIASFVRERTPSVFIR